MIAPHKILNHICNNYNISYECIRPGQDWREQDRTGHDRIGHDTTRHDTTRQDRIGQGRTRYDRIGQYTTGQDMTRHDTKEENKRKQILKASTLTYSDYVSSIGVVQCHNI